MGVRKLCSSLQKDLMSKSLYEWSPEDVGVWIRSLGSWAETNQYSQKFVDAGIRNETEYYRMYQMGSRADHITSNF